MVAAVQEQQSKDETGNIKKEKSDRHGPSLVARLESGLCHDQLSSKHFLVETGATCSVFFHRSSAPASGPVLTSPGGRHIATWGEMDIHLLFDGQHFTWNFVLAAVQLSFLGMDFLRQQGLLVDAGKPAHHDGLHEGHQSGGPIWWPRWSLRSSCLPLNGVQTPLC
jgi:hypothetical protein